MRTFFAMILSMGLTVACAESDFAGGSKASSPAKKKDTNKDDDPKLNKNGGKDDGGPILEDESEQELGKEETPLEETNEVCASSSPKDATDEAATFTFNNDGEVRAYVNSLGKYTHINEQYINAGGIKADQIAADAVCNMKGFKRGASFTTRKYSSCHDNYTYPWDPAAKNFTQINACDFNQRLDQLICQGKLKDICGEDPSWVFGQPPEKKKPVTP